MEIGLENLYVDIGAYIGLREVPLYFLLQRDSLAPENFVNLCQQLYSQFSNILADLVDNIDLV